MNILVATKETQGQRINDFCWAEEGEPVIYPLRCDGGSTDDNCGCSRSLAGIRSRKCTTTVKVAACDLSEKELAFEFLKSEKDAGWTTQGHEAILIAEDLCTVASQFPVGTVLEFRGTTFAERKGGTNALHVR